MTTTFVAATSAAAAGTAGSWKLTGSMSSPRSGSTATLLADGDVLVAGGSNGSGALARAELYDPSSGTWQPTGSMSSPRENFAATLLANGQVLAVGGTGTNGLPGLASAELYDPATGTWLPTGSMSTPRSAFTATLLANGTVLAVGGFAGSDQYSDVATAELYDPATGIWGSTGAMSTPRFGFTATRLGNGTVLVAGGGQNNPNTVSNALTSAEIYNPATGQWRSTPAMPTGHWNATASMLTNGQVLVAGGFGLSCCSFPVPMGIGNADLYDPVTGTWHAAAAMNIGRMDAAAVVLPDGTVLETGGLGPQTNDGILVQATDETYDPATNTWTSRPNMYQSREDQTASVLANGTVLVAGGLPNASSPAVATAEIYDPTGTPTGPQTALSPSVLNFNYLPEGYPSNPQTVTVTNTGWAPLTVSAATSSSSDYTATVGACTAIAPGASCPIQVVFTPHVAGDRGTSYASTATLLVQDNAPGSPHTVSLTGFGNNTGAPVITGLTPATGPTAGGTVVTITGTYLTGGDVFFGNVPATKMSCAETSCTATAPRLSSDMTLVRPGVVDVTVATGVNSTLSGTADQFTYLASAPPAPAITKIAPTTGPAAGGTTITVTGSNLGAGSVVFGSTPATAATCTTTSCTATSPAGTGTVDVRVSTSGGTSNTRAADQFSYQNPPPAPKVTKITPTSGPANGGTVVTVTGSNLAGGSVAFGAAPATHTTCTSTSCTATAPAGTGTVDVRVTTTAGASAATSADQFTYQAPSPAPTVNAITPNVGPAAGGTTVTVTGTNLSAGKVTFGSTAAAAVSCTSTVCTATSPAGTGVVDVRVTTTGGISAISTADRFSYQAAPPGANLVPNPGFETAAIPSDFWGGKLARSSTVSHTGSWSLAQTTTSGSGGWDLDSDPSGYAPVSAGKTYSTSIWVQASKTVKVTLNVDLLTVAGAYLTSVDGPTVTITANTWTKLTVTGIQPTANGVYAAMEPNFSAATTGIVINWDDMSLITP